MGGLLKYVWFYVSYSRSLQVPLYYSWAMIGVSYLRFCKYPDLTIYSPCLKVFFFLFRLRAQGAREDPRTRLHLSLAVSALRSYLDDTLVGTSAFIRVAHPIQDDPFLVVMLQVNILHTHEWHIRFLVVEYLRFYRCL